MKNNKSEIEEELINRTLDKINSVWETKSDNSLEEGEGIVDFDVLLESVKPALEFVYQSGILKAKDNFNKMINDFKKNTFGDKKQIINEADLQSGAIEFSYTGELYPVEKLETTFEELKQKIGEIK